MFGSGFGRFTSPDPLLASGRVESPQTWNRYAYVLNNPLRFIDPLGLYERSEELGGSQTDAQLLEGAGKDKGKTKAANKIIGHELLSEMGYKPRKMRDLVPTIQPKLQEQLVHTEQSLLQTVWNYE